MSAKLTWLDPHGNPECGHRRDQGFPGDDPGVWWCEACVAGFYTSLEASIAAVDAPPEPPAEALRAAVVETLARQTWHVAVTMPENPHAYALKREWTGPVRFDDVTTFIARYGYWGRWRGHRYKQFDWGDWFCWLLWPPYILINRKPITEKNAEPDDPRKGRSKLP